MNLLLVAALFGALTASESAQVKQFVGTAQPPNAQRVRAIVARPDLSTDESVRALSDATEPVLFNDARATFLRELVFGGASVPSRPVLALATTKAVLARADKLLLDHVGDLDKHPEATAELVRIYAFLDADIATVGLRRGAGREPQTGIPLATYDECARAIAQHVEKHARWLEADAAIPPAALRVRGQAQLALLDMMNESATWRVDVADRLGLVGPRRTFMTELGLLVIDDGHADGARVDRARAVLSRLPAARADAVAIVFGDDRPAFRSRGQVLAVKATLAPAGSAPATINPFPEDVDAAAIDPALVDLAGELATIAVRRALDQRGELRVGTERDLRAVTGDAKKLLAPATKPTPIQAEAALAAAVQLLVLDAPRTVDLALGRFASKQPEAAAFLADALGLLAVFSTSSQAADGLSIALGRAKGDGTTETTLATAVRLAPDGSATSFSIGGHRYELARGDSGVVVGVRRDGAPLTLAMVPSARVPVTDAVSWSDGGVVFARMRGAPRAGAAAGRVRVVGTSDSGVDAIATPAPGDDFTLEGDLRATGDGALVVRAAATKDGIRGVSLAIANGRATLRVSDGAQENELASGPANGTHVKIVVRGARIEATAGGAPITGTLPAALAHGDIALTVRRGASVELSGFTTRKP